MIIIGITGTLGAGKGTVVEYLTQHKNFSHYAARQFIKDEVVKRGLPVDRDSFTSVSNDLRAQHGPWVIAKSLYTTALETGKDAIIESLRTPGEVSFLREKDHFFLLAVDADLQVRYERIVKRNLETDQVSFERFKSDEEREMTATDPNKQNIAACIKMADAAIVNNGSVEELHATIDKALEKFFKTEKVV